MRNAECRMRNSVHGFLSVNSLRNGFIRRNCERPANRRVGRVAGGPAGVGGQLDVVPGGVDGVHFGLELAQQCALGFFGFGFVHVGLFPGSQGGAGGGDFGGRQAGICRRGLAASRDKPSP